MKTVGEKIIEVRKRKGLSQDALAEKASISLRTVQRIENNEVDPRGHTLSSICDALEINIEDILDYGKVEDKSFFCWFHLSVMSGIVIPFGDVILPLILWLMKRDSIIDLNKQGLNLLSFRLIYNGAFYMILYSGFTGPGRLFFLNFIPTFIYPLVVVLLIKKRGKLKNYYPRFFK